MPPAKLWRIPRDDPPDQLFTLEVWGEGAVTDQKSRRTYYWNLWSSAVSMVSLIQAGVKCVRIGHSVAYSEDVHRHSTAPHNGCSLIVRPAHLSGKSQTWKNLTNSGMHVVFNLAQLPQAMILWIESRQIQRCGMHYRRCLRKFFRREIKIKKCALHHKLGPRAEVAGFRTAARCFSTPIPF